MLTHPLAMRLRVQVGILPDQAIHPDVPGPLSQGSLLRPYANHIRPVGLALHRQNAVRLKQQESSVLRWSVACSIDTLRPRICCLARCQPCCTSARQKFELDMQQQSRRVGEEVVHLDVMEPVCHDALEQLVCSGV